MAPGDLDPSLLTGRWRLSLADYWMPERKAPDPHPANDGARTTKAGNGCPPGCRA